MRDIKQQIEWMDKTFPSKAPHHLAILSDKEYKERNKDNKIEYPISGKTK